MYVNGYEPVNTLVIFVVIERLCAITWASSVTGEQELKLKQFLENAEVSNLQFWQYNNGYKPVNTLLYVCKMYRHP